MAHRLNTLIQRSYSQEPVRDFPNATHKIDKQTKAQQLHPTQKKSSTGRSTSATDGNSLSTIAGSSNRAPPSPDHPNGTQSGKPSAQTQSPNPRGPPKLSKMTILLTMTSLCLSVTLSALDLTIITPAIPAIVGAFHSVSGYVWIGGAFILSYTAITPIWGSVADIWGRKPIMISALSIFLGGSLLCALAPHMKALVAGRAVQGVGASGMGIMVNVVISDMFSLRDRGLYLAITSVVWAIGSAVGPVLGGVFVSRLSWRWCFWLNLPVGGVVLIVFLFFLHLPNPHTPILAGIKAIDWPGSALIIGGALMILLGLDFGDVTFPWNSATVICLIVFGAVTIGGFVVNEWKLARNPIIPLRLFNGRSIIAAYGVYACNNYVFIGLTYYLPLYSQSVLGANALNSGLHLLPLVVSTSLAAAFAGILIQRTGKYLVIMYIAQVFLTLGVGLFINLSFVESLTKLFIFEILVGIGVGLNIDAPVLAAQAASTVRDTAAITATMGFARSLMTAISVVVGGIIFQNQMTMHNPRLVEQIGNAAARHFNGAEALANVELINSLPADQQDIIRRAYFSSIRIVWIMYVAFAGFATVLSFFIEGNHLSTETEDIVLGVNREKPEALPIKSGAQSQENIGTSQSCQARAER